MHHPPAPSPHWLAPLYILPPFQLLQLSLGGKLALAFGALMERLWQGEVGHVSPKLFKWQLAKFAPQFSGYAQQDSQELLAFLLDGLHEVGGWGWGCVLSALHAQLERLNALLLPPSSHTKPTSSPLPSCLRSSCHCRT